MLIYITKFKKKRHNNPNSYWSFFAAPQTSSVKMKIKFTYKLEVKQYYTKEKEASPQLAGNKYQKLKKPYTVSRCHLLDKQYYTIFITSLLEYTLMNQLKTKGFQPQN